MGCCKEGPQKAYARVVVRGKRKKQGVKKQEAKKQEERKLLLASSGF
jgi:hypothetical protein